MEQRRLVNGIARLYIVAFTAAGLIVSAFAWAARAQFYEEKFVWANLTGVHHLGTRYKIDESMSTQPMAAMSGGAGSCSCYVKLPKTWKPGLTVMVRWAVNDLIKAKRAETAAGN